MTNRPHPLWLFPGPVYPHRRPQRGQALVEFALVTPLFLALVCGIAETALIFLGTIACQRAAISAAQRIAISGATTSAIDQQAAQALASATASIFTVHLTGIEIAQVNADGTILRENRFDGTGQPIGAIGWPVAGRNSTASTPLFVMVRVSFTYQWITAFFGAIGQTLALQASATAMAPPLGG